MILKLIINLVTYYSFIKNKYRALILFYKYRYISLMGDFSILKYKENSMKKNL